MERSQCSCSCCTRRHMSSDQSLCILDMRRLSKEHSSDTVEISKSKHFLMLSCSWTLECHMFRDSFWTLSSEPSSDSRLYTKSHIMTREKGFKTDSFIQWQVQTIYVGLTIICDLSKILSSCNRSNMSAILSFSSESRWYRGGATLKELWSATDAISLVQS